MAVQTVKAVINGQTVNLMYNQETQAWEAQTTAPATSSYKEAGHYYGVEVTATDDAGNSTTVSATSGDFQEDLRLVVKEKVAPVITVTSPTADAFIINNKPTIQWSITDDDSGVDPDTIKININGASITEGITKTPAGKGYTCSYTPTTAIADGECTILFDASDHDGNAAVQKSVVFTVDTVAPTLNVTAPTEGLKTNKNTVTVTGTTNDVTSSPVTVTVKLNSGAAEEVTVQSNGSFSKQITLSSGANTIVVTATDSAGKSTSVTRHVTLDTGAPVFTSIELVPNPVDAGATYIIRVKVTD